MQKILCSLAVVGLLVLPPSISQASEDGGTAKGLAVSAQDLTPSSWQIWLAAWTT